MSTDQTINNNNNQPSSAFGGLDAELADRLAAPVSPTTEKSSAEARRRTSEWKPPSTTTTTTTMTAAPPAPQRTFSFDHEEHKRSMMAASGALSGSGGPAGSQGFTERG